MESLVCRDCGTELQPTARGCSHCALNLEAEAMVERVVVRLILTLAIMSIAGLVLVFLLLR